jgi:hypothetical protein
LCTRLQSDHFCVSSMVCRAVFIPLT